MNFFLKSVLAWGMLSSAAVMAQSANDAGISVVSRGVSLINAVPQPAGTVCPVGIIAGAFTGTNTQDGRIFRDAVASTCPNKVYPGIFGAGTLFNFETYTFPNTSAAAACVTVNFDPDTAPGTPCATNAHMSAYAGSYDPVNQGTNFLGDVGSSLAQPFAIEVAANSDLVLVVSNTSAAAICDFAFEVVDLPCSAVVAGPARAVPANNSWSMGLLAGLALLIGGLVFVRARH